MSRLKELIQEYCPDGVEYKRFEDVCTLHARIGWQRLTRAEYMPEGDYLLITGTDFTDSHEINYESCVYVTKNRYDQDSKIQVENGDVLITKDGTLGKVAQVTNLPMPATLNGGVFVVRPINNELLPRFIMHFLLSKHFKDKVFQQKTGSTISHLTQGLFSRLEIPIPPLPVQQEIVRILDSFSNLEQELEQELEQRKKQYEFYRSDLLNNSDFQTMYLKDVLISISSGKNKDRTNNGIYPVYGSTGIISRTNNVAYDKPQILVARVGANAGYVQIAEGQYDVSDNTLIVDVNERYSLKYIYYLLVNSNLNQYAKGGGQPLITAGDLKKLIIHIPTRNEQDRIVNYLDKFNSLCTDLTSGLPAEISLRKKQYEYYRDRLLSFPRKA